jgi:triacylglycerol esterase/lipase EstA (alpha/beta hydrolase family)
MIAQPALAQSACPAGSSIAIVRLSQLVPAGSMDGARKAATDHEQWYASHGYAADKILFAPVLSFDRATKKASASNQFYTIHLKSTDVPMTRHDAAWTAYVAEYDQNSKIVSTNVACMPD